MLPTDPSPGRRALEHALAALSYFALTAFYLRPILRVFGTHIAPDPGDPMFILIVLKWGMHQMRLGMPDFWDLPFLFPAQGVTAYSDHLLGPAAFGLLFTNPLAAYNALLLGAFVLTGWSTWYVLRRRGVGAVAAFLGGCMFAFCPIRLDHLSHLQILLMPWIPLTLWSWDRLLERPDGRRAVLFLIFYALHVTGGSYLAYMIHVPMLVLLLCRMPALWRSSAAKVLVPAGLAAAAVLAAVFLPYLEASRYQERSAEEVQGGGASLASYVALSPHSVYSGPWSEPWRRPENALFPGFAVSALVLIAASRALPRRWQPPLFPLAWWQKLVIGILLAAALAGLVRGEMQTWWAASRIGWEIATTPAAWRTTGRLLVLGLVLALLLRRRWGGNWPLSLQGLDAWERGMLISAVVCFLLSLGPVYILLMKLVPGLSGMRVPARFAAFVTFSLVFFAAREMDRLLRATTRVAPTWRAGPRPVRVLAAILLAGFLFVELAPKPLQWTPIPQEADFPEAVRWLGRQNDVRAVLVLPFGDTLHELSNMYLGTLSWKPLVNGYSGYLTRNYVTFREECCSPVPQGPQLDRLRVWGVTHILLRPEALEKKWQRQIFKDWQRRPDIAPVFAAEGYRVYRILPAAEPGG